MGGENPNFWGVPPKKGVVFPPLNGVGARALRLFSPGPFPKKSVWPKFPFLKTRGIGFWGKRARVGNPLFHILKKFGNPPRPRVFGPGFTIF